MRSAISAVIVAAMVVAAQGQTNQEPAQMRGARVRYERAMETAKSTYEQELDSLKRQLTQDGNLDGALRVKAELDRIDGKTAPPNTSPAEKKDDYVVFQGHRYEVITKSATRRRAESDCRKRGGALACAETSEELNFLHDLMRRTMVSPFWVDSKVGVAGGQWMRVNGAMDSNPPKKGVEELPYICEWSQDADDRANKPADRTH